MSERGISRRDFMRGSVLAAGAVGAGSLLAACGAVGGTGAQSTLERIREQGFVRVAIANEPPYTQIVEATRVSGAAPEIARAALSRMGVEELDGVITEYGSMIPGLQAGRFDMITAGLFMTPERCAEILYSQPDVCGTESFAVPAGNPLGLMSYADVAAHDSARVGVPGGSVEEGYAQEAGVPADRIVVIPDSQSGIDALQAGRIDAYGLPTLSIKDLLGNNPDAALEEAGPLEDTPVNCAGAGFRRDDAEFRDAYDAALQELKDSGEFTRILEEWGFPGQAAIDTTRDELCGGPNVP